MGDWDDTDPSAAGRASCVNAMRYTLAKRPADCWWLGELWSRHGPGASVHG